MTQQRVKVRQAESLNGFGLCPSCVLARKRSSNASGRVIWQLLLSHSHPFPFQKIKGLSASGLLGSKDSIKHRHICMFTSASLSVKHGKCQWGHAQGVCKACSTCPVIKSLSKQCYMPWNDKSWPYFQLFQKSAPSRSINLTWGKHLLSPTLWCYSC